MLMMNEATLDGAVVSADRVATVFDDNCHSIMPKALSLLHRGPCIAGGERTDLSPLRLRQ